MSLADLLISLGSAGLVVFTLPTALNKSSQVPRKIASIPTATILSYLAPLFATSGLVLTSLTVAGQAIVWWLIVLFRPVKIQNRDKQSVAFPESSDAQRIPQPFKSRIIRPRWRGRRSSIPQERPRRKTLDQGSSRQTQPRIQAYRIRGEHSSILEDQ